MPARSDRRGRAAATGAFVLLLFLGCSSDDSAASGGDPEVHAEGQGPLSASLGGGGNGLYAPPGAGTWTGTFGAALLCTTTPEAIRIEAVQYDVRLPAVELVSSVRVVPKAEDRRPQGQYAPVASIMGDARALAASGEMSGTLDERVKGTIVADQCPVEPDESYLELLTTLTVNGRGAWIDGLDIIYSLENDEGRRFSLTVAWEYVACGSAVDDRDLC